MDGGQKIAPARGHAQPGLGHSEMAGNVTIARRRRQLKFIITPESGESFEMTTSGREAWALRQLAEAGARGVTPLERPAPRWSAYVHTLRASGVPIATLREKHGGEFSGTHGRYVLNAKIRCDI